jgi:hypothetical protein
MPWIDDRRVGKCEQLRADRTFERPVVPAGKIRPADAAGEEDVAGNDRSVKDERDASRRMAGGFDDADGPRRGADSSSSPSAR